MANMETGHQEIIDSCLACKAYAVIGVSTNRSKFGFRVYNLLKDNGYTVFPVNPLYDDIFGDRCYPDLESLPEKVDVVEFVCPPAVTTETVKLLPSLGIEKAWMQPGAESEEAILFCRENGITLLHNTCLLVELGRTVR